MSGESERTMVKQKQAYLRKDSKVEIRPQNNKRNNLGNSSKALAQYDHLVSDEDPNKLLTELVDVLSIRPVPPPDNPDQPFQPFEPADVVDASYLDTWWVGVVMKFEDDKYTVGFKNPSDLLQLRPPWDLQDGIWVRARKERMAEATFSPGTAVEVNLNEKNQVARLESLH
ncbi:uncharacterized protein Pyn_23407 [Prunus yedoensis var. nudiflora]|uniref:Agenet-like domain-containing protein n=1 Tax=Prunus yedoensis var. nudiflora TaxID=2094558 RepID=A0A314YBB6_PRUYE|nr:uncharacterized protein Pyn_23407 [Prunus yedoensis var. nudiflora]